MKVLYRAAPLLLYVRTMKHPNHRVVIRLHNSNKLVEHPNHRVVIRLHNSNKLAEHLNHRVIIKLLHYSNKLTNPQQVAQLNQQKIESVFVNHALASFTKMAAILVKNKFFAKIAIKRHVSIAKKKLSSCLLKMLVVLLTREAKN
jgi:hypothetical protein